MACTFLLALVLAGPVQPAVYGNTTVLALAGGHAFAADDILGAQQGRDLGPPQVIPSYLEPRHDCPISFVDSSTHQNSRNSLDSMPRSSS